MSIRVDKVAVVPTVTDDQTDASNANDPKTAEAMIGVNSTPGIGAGFLAAVPISLGVSAYGLAFGVLAAAAGLSGLDVIVMGIAIFAGSAQVIAVERLAAGDSLWLAILPALAINLRYGAILASLRPLLAQTPKPLWPLAVHLTADENWALTLARRTSDARIGHSFLIGSGLCVMAAFTGASALATTFLTQAPDLSAFGISFAFTAAFIALARGLWRGSADFAPWLATAAATLALQYLLDQAALAILLGSATGVAVDMTNRAKRTA